MIQENISKMVKSKKEIITPRRRPSISKNGAIGKVATRVISRPVSSAAPCVAPVCNIRVVVRVRPPNEKEQDDNFHNVVKVVDEQMLIFDPKEEEQPFFYHGVQQKTRDLLKKAKKDITFVFDKVFHNACSNLEVFNSTTKTLIDTLMDGYNCSIFAYGATGAGKTFTMIGNTESPGITYLTMKDLFKRKEELSSDRDFELMLTYIEVYNELVKDLLNPGVPLNLREDAKYGVMIPGVKGHKINSPDELFSLLEQGNKRRTQHPTDANAESSRSHAVFQVYIQMTLKGTREVRRAKLSMIDLAGSERGSATGFVGARFKEGANINKSLLALGNCINSLADGHRHVPYRDSKLTRLLKDSLGGNCHTIMIANISPSSMSFDDTYNTLKYATRAKKIKSNMKRNIVNVDMHIDQYIKLVEDLQTENSSLKADNLKMKRELEQLRTEPQPSENTQNSSCDDIKDVGELNEDTELVKNEKESLMLDSLNPESDSEALRQLTQAREMAERYQQEVEALKVDNELLKKQNTVIHEKLQPEVLEAFTKLVVEKKELMETEFQLQSTELGMSLRRQLKTETKARLSNFYVYTPDKEDMRKKLADQVERYERKEKGTNTRIEEVRQGKASVVERLRELVALNPELGEMLRLADMEIDGLGLKYKADLKQKEIEILLDDHKDKCSIIENMARLLKQLFLAAGGRLDAPESIKREYDNLVNAFNGKKSLRWQPDPESECLGVPMPSDSGVSSLASIPENTEEQSSRANKRKIETTDSQVSLDSTFTCLTGIGTKTPPRQGGATFAGKTPTPGSKTTQMVAKGFRAPAAKRVANGISPRPRFSPRSKLSPSSRISPRSKENHHSKRPPIRPDTVRALINARKVPPKTLPERPRFRM